MSRCFTDCQIPRFFQKFRCEANFSGKPSSALYPPSSYISPSSRKPTLSFPNSPSPSYNSANPAIRRQSIFWERHSSFSNNSWINFPFKKRIKCSLICSSLGFHECEWKPPKSGQPYESWMALPIIFFFPTYSQSVPAVPLPCMFVLFISPIFLFILSFPPFDYHPIIGPIKSHQSIDGGFSFVPILILIQGRSSP